MPIAPHRLELKEFQILCKKTENLFLAERTTDHQKVLIQKEVAHNLSDHTKNIHMLSINTATNSSPFFLKLLGFDASVETTQNGFESVIYKFFEPFEGCLEDDLQRLESDGIPFENENILKVVEAILIALVFSSQRLGLQISKLEPKNILYDCHYNVKIFTPEFEPLPSLEEEKSSLDFQSSAQNTPDRKNSMMQEDVPLSPATETNSALQSLGKLIIRMIDFQTYQELEATTGKSCKIKLLKPLASKHQQLVSIATYLLQLQDAQRISAENALAHYFSQTQVTSSS